MDANTMNQVKEAMRKAYQKNMADEFTKDFLESNPETTVNELIDILDIQNGRVVVSSKMESMGVSLLLGTIKIQDGVRIFPELLVPLDQHFVVSVDQDYVDPDIENGRFLSVTVRENEKYKEIFGKFEKQYIDRTNDIKRYFDRSNNVSHIHIINHPLLNHKLNILCDQNTGTNEFRKVVGEITELIGYEALRDLPTEKVGVDSYFGHFLGDQISGKKLCIVPVLRAGLGMVEGILSLVPTAKVGHIGLCRDAETKEPMQYYCKLPDQLDQRDIVVLDPMLATGGSASQAVSDIKELGGKRIRFICLFAAPEGIKRLMADHPDIELFACCLKPGLDSNKFIINGCGDCGDRLFGTK